MSVARVGKGAALYGAARSGEEKFPGVGKDRPLCKKEKKGCWCARTHTP